MAVYTKVPHSGGTWRLMDADGTPLGRIWSAAHIDRIIRDGDYAEAVEPVLSQTGSARRTTARNHLSTWQTSGGHSVDLSSMTLSLNNDAGIEDSNQHLFIAGNEFGYLHGVDTARDQRVLRIVRLLEEVFAGEQLGTSTLRNQALDAALDRFRDDGALD